MPNTIRLTRKDISIQQEAQASETITPGQLIEYGGSNDLQKHSTSAGRSAKMIAVEDDLQGNGIDDDYSSDAQVIYRHAQSGEVYYMQLANGESVNKGDMLESAGNGNLQAQTGNDWFAMAEEGVDATSSAGGGPKRIRARIV